MFVAREFLVWPDIIIVLKRSDDVFTGTLAFRVWLNCILQMSGKQMMCVLCTRLPVFFLWTVKSYLIAAREQLRAAEHEA